MNVATHSKWIDILFPGISINLSLPKFRKYYASFLSKIHAERISGISDAIFD